MNMMNSKNLILNFENKDVTISICKNINMSIFIYKKISIYCIVKTIQKTIILIEKTMTISMKLKKAKLSKKSKL